MSANFMIDYIKLKYTDSKKLSRKHYLEPLAFIFNIKTYKYSNRNLLISAIIAAIPQSKKYYNSSDPVSLQSLDEIEPKYLFEWIMNNKMYAMHIKNLYKLIENKQTILPWALDEVSGIYKSKFPDIYKQKYDMQFCEGLLEDIRKCYLDLKNELDDEHDDYKISVFTKERFKFENLIDELKYSAHGVNSSGQELYVSHLVDIFIQLNIFKAFKIICYTFSHCKIYFNNLYIDYILNSVETQIYHEITVGTYDDPNIASLLMLNKTFDLIKSNLDYKYSCGVIRYVLLLLNELFE